MEDGQIFFCFLLLDPVFYISGTFFTLDITLIS